MEKNIKKKNIDTDVRDSRYLLGFIAFIIFNIIFINEHISVKAFSILFAFIAYFASFPGTFVTNCIMKLASKLKGTGLKLIYYLFVLPILIFLLFAGCWVLLGDFFENFVNGWNSAFTALFVMIVVSIFIIVPYVLAVLIELMKLSDR